MKRFLKIVGKIALIALASVVGLVLAFLLVMNIAKFAIYSDYYGIKRDICKNPGLADGFVCQGICAYEEQDLIFVSGYMADKSASRIYVTDTDDNSYYVSLYEDGKSFTGHAGGIAVNGDKVYVASSKAVHIISVDSLLNAEAGDEVMFEESVPVNNSASFIYADESYLYVGEFHDGGKYVTEHTYDTYEGQHNAIVSRYSYLDLTTPDRVYSIRDKVQGICFTPDGKVVMSTSYGLSDSVYYVYNEFDASNSGYTLDGAPVYYLDDCVEEFGGPAMAEGLDYRNGKIITLTESASDKYIFGKFFFANYIVELDLSELE